MIATVSKAEFARIIGRDRAWVTRMAQEGRLAMEGEGPKARVKVAESRALIDQTRGTRDDVADRHAENRSYQGFHGNERPEPDESMERARKVKAVSEARRVAALADTEEMNRDKLAGNLIAREDVDAAMRFVGSTFRGLTDVMPDQLAPVLAPGMSVDDAHAALADAVRDLQQRFAEAVTKQSETMAREGV